MRRLATAILATVVLGSALPAAAQVQSTFPRLRVGRGVEPNAGGGVVAGDQYVTHAAAILWNRRWHTLTLYLFWRRRVTCSTLRSAIAKPGHLIQVYVTNQPRVSVNTRVAAPQVAFVTVYRNTKTPPHVDGLKEGAQLTFTRVDSYPHGIWHGELRIPKRRYANGKTYGYDGTFRATWCQIAS